MEQVAQWDRELFVFLNNQGTAQFDSFWLVVTQIENWIPLYIVFFLSLWKFLSKKEAILATLLAFGTLASMLSITSLVKNLVGRLRPNNTSELDTLIRVLQTPSDYSFWSGHAATSFAVTVFVVSTLNKKTKWAYIFFIWPLLFTVSRVFVGVHYPTDLLVGAFMGSLLGAGFYRLYTSLSK